MEDELAGAIRWSVKGTSEITPGAADNSSIKSDMHQDGWYPDQLFGPCKRTSLIEGRCAYIPQFLFQKLLKWAHDLPSAQNQPE
jgi:hypothetical protein